MPAAQTASNTRPLQIVIVGGGLAGVAAATALASRLTPDLANITLLESRFALGGRATSFPDPENESHLLDNCQHVLLGCCTNLLDLYTRLGVGDQVDFHRTVHFLGSDGYRHDLKGIRGLPAPLHLGPGMAMFTLLNAQERLAIIKAMLVMLKIGHTGRAKMDDISFGDWVKEMGQPDELFKKFYDPVLISALNEDTRKVSAKYAIQVFQDAMMAHRRGYLVGLPKLPLSALLEKLPSNVTLKLNTRVDDLHFDNPKSKSANAFATAITTRNGEKFDADILILATNHHAVQKAVPQHLQSTDIRFRNLSKLESVPILGVHLWFDRPIFTEPAVALVDGPLQWLFRKDKDGRILHGVLSAARDWDKIPKDEALKRFTKQVNTQFPKEGQKDAILNRGIIVIEKRATFAPLPGADAFRPTQAPPTGDTGIENLFLAGDYTKTDWPATMEGAVRSGYLAADAALAYLCKRDPSRIPAQKKPCLVPDLRVELPARLMGLAK